MRTNLLPGCSCFSLNGGAVQLQVALTPHVSLIGDLTLTQKGGITADDYTLKQLTYTGGLQLRLGSRFSLVPEEADNLLTTFNNTASNRQNDLRLSAVFLFGYHDGCERPGCLLYIILRVAVDRQSYKFPRLEKIDE